MPLRCIADSGDLNAFDQTAESWAALKSNYRELHLRTTCCGLQAIPKTSSLGTFFFAHSRRGDCTSAPESKEHLLAKTTIAKAAQAAGWDVTTECRGETPVGEPWIADILVQRGQTKIAFEVQWSRQNDKDTALRQKQYKDSGVRCLWLMKQLDFNSSRNVPAFNLTLNNDQSFAVKLPSTLIESSIAARRDSLKPWLQEVDLQEFVVGALGKKLAWRPLVGKTAELFLRGWSKECWRCHKTTQTLQELVINPEKDFPGYPSVEILITDFLHYPNLLNNILPKSFLKQCGIGELKERIGYRSKNQSYLANNCVHCDAHQDRYNDDYYGCHRGVVYCSNIGPIAESKITVTEEFERALLFRNGSSREWLNKWYFQRSFD